MVHEQSETIRDLVDKVLLRGKGRRNVVLQSDNKAGATQEKITIV